MNKKVTCFLPFSSWDEVQPTIDSLKVSEETGAIYLVAKEAMGECPEGCYWLEADSMVSTATVKAIAEKATTPYTLIYTKQLPLQLGQFALERFMQVADDTGAGMVYSNYFESKEGQLPSHPVIDYQQGSLRDDFNFGSVLFYLTKLLKDAVEHTQEIYDFAGLYNLRLKVSQKANLWRIPEYLYTEVELDTRRSGEKVFDYVDPKNRRVQEEMEQACTQHLKAIGAWLKPEFTAIQFDKGTFEYEASVIIPVLNRLKTVEDAIKSVLNQKTNFKFNLIVVDNHSTDGTTELLKKYAAQDDRLIHLIPDRNDLGIGGCWNVGIMDSRCGKFAVQLDSDDLYIDEHVLQRIVDAFYAQQCAMVIGSYQMVNFKLEEIPPGIIDHREWTPENGRNNALRINGLGAPRAFYTPVLRNIRVPNVSYGEDYAVGLAISRHYQIGRIYDPLYLCRRWDDNSDASLDINKQNAHNTYKDRVRTIELLARKQLNQH